VVCGQQGCIQHPSHRQLQETHPAQTGARHSRHVSRAELHPTPQWIPREQNLLADELSRGPDQDDWSLIQDHFDALDELWGPHTVDRFASSTNSKCSRLKSKLHNIGSEATDAFTQDWSMDNNWFCPPVGLIAKVLHQCRAQNARGTLIVPCWPSSYFWSLIKTENGRFASFVIAHKHFHGTFKKNNALNKCVFDAYPLFDTLALRLDFDNMF